MAGLFGVLSIANEAMQAQQAGLNVVANNIANVNTPGYSRQIAQLAEQAPFSSSDGGGGGVTLQQVQSVRDNVLEIRLNQETSNQGRLTSMQQQLNPVQALFQSQGGAGLGAAVDAFFNSLQQLSTAPTSGAQRQSVLTAGQTMAQTFQQVANGLSQQVAGADQEVVQQTAQANTLLGQIAKINGQVAQLQNGGQSAGALVDQRTQLVRQLSGILDVAVSDGGNGQITLTTAQGAPLVLGTEASTLGLQANPSGTHEIMDNGNDITSTITGGSLAGVIASRDQAIPQLSGQLDQLASSLINAVNAQNKLGFTPTGAAGGNLFTPPSAGVSAAATMQMATSDPNAIAASGSATAPAGNSNLLQMQAIQQQGIVGGQTPDNAYAGLVSSIGGMLQGVNTQQQSSQLVLTQLQNQRSSLSGVSLDEEGVQLQQFQNAYQAAARVVAAINQLTQIAIQMGGQ